MRQSQLLTGYRDAAGRVEVECWCGAQWIRVPATDVRAGRTGTCTTYGCRQGDAYHGPPARGRPARKVRA